MSSQIRWGGTLCWVAAWFLAFLPSAIYLAWPSSLIWWIGPVFAFPLLALIATRSEARRAPDGSPDNGPYGPPSDFGGPF